MKLLKFKVQNPKSKCDGYIAITTSIVLSFLVLVIAIALGSSSLFSRNNNLNFSYKKTSNYVSRTCLEYALLELAVDSGYVGGEIKTIDSHQCSIVSVTGVDPKVIRASSTIRGVTTNLELTVNESDLSTVSLEELVQF